MLYMLIRVDEEKPRRIGLTYLLASQLKELWEKSGWYKYEIKPMRKEDF